MTNHVLLVEDSPLASDALRLLLESAGYRVSLADTVATALTALRTDPPQLVLLDLTLPDGDGLEVASAVMDDDDGPIVVALTGHDSLEVAERCRTAGCVAVMVKPVSLQQIVATVSPLLRAK